MPAYMISRMMASPPASDDGGGDGARDTRPTKGESTMHQHGTAKRLIAASLLSLTLFAGAGTAGLVTEPSLAHAERGPRGTGITQTAPQGTQTSVAEMVVGHPKTGAAGQATGAECRAYAAAINAIAEQAEQDLQAGRDSSPGMGKVPEGLVQAGGARGCVFMVQ